MDDFIKGFFAQVELDDKVRDFKNNHGLIIKSEQAILLKVKLPMQNSRNFIYYQCCKDYSEIEINDKYECILCIQANHCCQGYVATMNIKYCIFHQF